MRTPITLGILVLTLLMSACNGGGGGGHHKTNFQSFVQNLATTPLDNADPVAIDGLNFTVTEDPHAFDALFQ